MDASQFDEFVARLAAGPNRRAALRGLIGGALAALGIAAASEDGEARKRKGGRDTDDDVVGDKNKGKRQKKKCKKKQAKACNGQCGTVRVKCKRGKGKAKTKQVNCGSCVCDPPCEECFLCDGAEAACVVDPDQQGVACGEAGQVCQEDGACACDDESCPACAICQADGACTVPCDGSGCCTNGACVSGSSPDACGTGGAACVACTGDELCLDGACVVLACDVCETGCPFTEVQAAVNAAEEGNTITVCPGAYVGGVVIDKDLTLSGVGVAVTTLDGNNVAQVIVIEVGTTVTIQNLTVTGGNAGGAESGGGIFNNGDLTLDTVTVTGNTAVAGGGLVNLEQSTVTLIDCVLSGNTSTLNGGGIFSAGMATLIGSSVTGNNSGDTGGGIFNIGTLTLEAGSSVTGNHAVNVGGGIINGVTVACTGGSTVSGNTAGGSPAASNCIDAGPGSGCDSCNEP